MSQSLTFIQARDDLLELIATAWATTGHTIKFPDKLFAFPNPAAPHAVVHIKHGPSKQAALGTSGGSRFERTGLIITQVYAPMGEGLSEPYTLAKVLADALEGKQTSRGVWFRDVEITEQDSDAVYAQVDIKAMFIYDEVK
jgi:hypothetical protein